MNKKLKSKIFELSIMAAMLSGDYSDEYNGYAQPSQEQREAQKKKVQEGVIKTKKKQGLKEYFYEGGSVWALSQKSAYRKINKLKS